MDSQSWDPNHLLFLVECLRFVALGLSSFFLTVRCWALPPSVHFDILGSVLWGGSFFTLQGTQQVPSNWKLRFGNVLLGFPDPHRMDSSVQVPTPGVILSCCLLFYPTCLHFLFVIWEMVSILLPSSPLRILFLCSYFLGFKTCFHCKNISFCFSFFFFNFLGVIFPFIF